MAEETRKIVMTETYTPDSDGRGRTRYAGSEYEVPKEVADEIREAGAGHYKNESANAAGSVNTKKDDAKK